VILLKFLAAFDRDVYYVFPDFIWILKGNLFIFLLREFFFLNLTVAFEREIL